MYEKRLQLAGDDEDGDRVRALLALLDEPLPRGDAWLFLLSYEACVALDPRSPRKPRREALGPDVVIRQVQRVAPTEAPLAPPPRVMKPSRAAHDAHVARIRVARERLLDGVIYQANLAHRLDVAPASLGDGLAFFHDVVASGPPPCAAFVDMPGWGSVVSLSPERFVMADMKARTATTYPIKGTRPRGATPDEDKRLLDELCASQKDAAEHVMIVDLLRNDLGKIAVPGGVTVERLLDVVSVKNVHHLESTVGARLRDGVGIAHVLEATIPGGSITGAPKSSAVDVIHELEDGPRGLYTGVLGVVEDGKLWSSLLIRTWLRPDAGKGSLHVGGGIVVDSEPEAEWQETLDKAAAFTSPR
jgi:para-aminobenzoate synthetase component 1